MLIRAIEDLKPTHLAIVFDHPSPTFRHLEYVGYQSNREKDRQISEDIWGQIDKLKQVFELLNVPVFQVSGFEADDVIGTLATQCVDEAVIITGDRDLMQLVTDRVKLYMPLKGLSDSVIIDSDKVKERLGILPEQVIDYKALVGDGSDNYPGVTGIGPKTAVDLLSKYSNFESVYKNLDLVKESIKQKLINGYDGGVLSQRLATIRRDAPATLNMDKCPIPPEENFIEVFKKLGHKSLIRRVSGQEVEIDDSQQKLFD